jgi:catechol 2,3-dioxygenase-like lactoylglutathione lyase family enzyme
MLDHVTLGVTNLERSKAFYDSALKPLGIAPLFERPTYVGYGEGQRPYFWIGLRPEMTSPDASTGAHVAFTSTDRATVDAFYEAALAAGGRDNGAPGVRSHYHPNYYGAFVLDPDGHNIEAVCHRPPDG